MSASDSRDIQNLLKEIESAKQDVAEAKGRLTVIKKDLKEVAGTDDLKKAKDKIDSWGTEVSELEEDLEKIMKDLRKNYDW